MGGGFADGQLGQREQLTVDGRQGFILEPPADHRIEGPMPWVWYAPTLGNRYPCADEKWMFDRLHAAGIAIAGIDVGESYGSPAGREVYQHFFETLANDRGFSAQPVLLGRSRGGLMLLSWAVEHVECVGGIAGIYPVCNVASYPGLEKAAPAYGLTTEQLELELARHNPVERLEALAAAKVPIFHIQGDSDRVVPHEENTGLLAERYGELGGPIQVELIEGQGHNMWRGWFESESLVDFMIKKALGWPDFELASPFVDGAILQRRMPIPVWGWSSPGDSITVEFGGQEKTGTADSQGRWEVVLTPVEASTEARPLRVSNGNREIEINNILVGEVWLASGQSNMDWVAGRSNCRELANELARATQDVPIREYAVDIGSSLFPQDRTTSAEGWKSSKAAGSFSALGLAFAWDLYQELEVPVGIIRSSHGATPIETWTSYEGFLSQESLNDIALRVRQSNPTTQDGKNAAETFAEELRAWRDTSATQLDRGGTALPRPRLPGIADDWKGATRMFNRKVQPLVPYGLRGVIWCQGESNSNDGRVYAAKMAALVHGLRLAWNQPDLPFYFTQLQCYGIPDVNKVGFGDLREAQTRFFKNSHHVGMVAQHDLNPANPGGIHPYNKLDPGKRLARWALANDYGKDVPYVGPLYQSHEIEGDVVRVRFEQRGPGGGLMVGSKGMEADAKADPKAFVEPAVATPGEPLKHFWLAGEDKVWHPAVAKIDGQTIVVQSPQVREPVGVSYAYMNSPIGANLYNEAGLPAIPFAYFDGKQMFNEDDPKIVAAAKADAEARYGKKTYLLPSTLFRDHCVLQVGRPVPVWGHGIPGTTVTVKFSGQVKQSKVDEFERWSVTLDAMKSSSEGSDLVIQSSADEVRTIRDVWVGDVWILTGSRQLDGQLMRSASGEENNHVDLSGVREFRIKTKARRFRSPRKLKMEIGGGKYVASWQTADFDDQGDPPSVFAYEFAKKVKRPNVPLGLVTLGAENPPITWVSQPAMQNAVGFEAERDELNLAFPNTEVCRKAVEDYLQDMTVYHRRVADRLLRHQRVPFAWSNSAPAFPQPYYNEWVSRTETPTHTYNFCISPLVPYAIRGVVWAPLKENLSDDLRKYGASVEIMAKNLGTTFGQDKVFFVYAQPSAALAPGVQRPKIKDSAMVELNEWPKSLSAIGRELGEAAANLAQ